VQDCFADGRIISGRVTDMSNTPIDHISIQVYDSSGRLVRAAFTDGLGNYSADRLGAGQFDVAVASISQELARRRGVASQSAGIDFRVPLAEVNGLVLGPDGKPAIGATVRADSIDWAILREGTTGSDGSFSLRHLPPAPVDLEATAPGYKQSAVRVDLSKGVHTPVVLRLQGLSTLNITVLEKTTRQPLPHVTVNVVELKAGTPSYRYIGETDASGRVTDTKAKPGMVTAVAANPLRESARVEVRADPTKPTNVTLLLDRSATLFVRFSRNIDQLNSQIYAKPLADRPAGDVGGYTGDFTGGGYKIQMPAGRYRLYLALSDKVAEPPSRALVVVPARRTQETVEFTINGGQIKVIQAK
jgi:hypothetical protein